MRLKSVLAVMAAFMMVVTIVAVAQDAPKENKPVPPILKYTVKSLGGQDVNLADYQGKVILFVNTASKCGFTVQYEGLEALYKKYKDKGLVVLGFPSNDFKGQEPGTDAEIAEFCKAEYGVTFPMFSKIVVKGDAKAPLYKYLTDTAKPSGEIKWNFEKFLVSRDGSITGRYLSAITPMSNELTKAIEAELAKN